MDYLEPSRLWFLLIVAGLVAVYVAVQRSRAKYAVRFTNVALLEAVAPKRPGWRRHVTAIAFIAAIAAPVVAFARPTQGARVPREKANGHHGDRHVAVGGGAQDVGPDPHRGREGDRQSKFLDLLPPKINIGPRAASTPSLGGGRADRPTGRRLKQGDRPPQARQGRRSIGEAIFATLSDQLGAARRQARPRQRIVLMSDGKTTDGRPDDVAARARSMPACVSTIAFGTDNGTIPAPSEPDVQIPCPSIAKLRKIADTTKGKSFSA